MPPCPRPRAPARCPRKSTRALCAVCASSPAAVSSWAGERAPFADGAAFASERTPAVACPSNCATTAWGGARTSPAERVQSVGQSGLVNAREQVRGRRRGKSEKGAPPTWGGGSAGASGRQARLDSGRGGRRTLTSACTGSFDGYTALIDAWIPQTARPHRLRSLLLPFGTARDTRPSSLILLAGLDHSLPLLTC